MKDFLLYIWQLPQVLCGLLFSLLHKDALKQNYNGVIVYRSTKMHGGLSFGKYIFVNKFANMSAIKHEYGHCVQSKALGWFYPIVIWLPTLVWIYLRENEMFLDKSYYWFYTEKSADRLGGVQRQKKN